MIRPRWNAVDVDTGIPWIALGRISACVRRRRGPTWMKEFAIGDFDEIMTTAGLWIVQSMVCYDHIGIGVTSLTALAEFTITQNPLSALRLQGPSQLKTRTQR